MKQKQAPKMPNKLTRQQKREVLRKLQDPKTLKTLLKQEENRKARELEEFKKSKLRKRAIIFGVILTLGLAALFIFG